MTYHDSHLMSLIAELKQSRNVRDQREEKMLCVVEGLLQRIERLENPPKQSVGTLNNPSWLVELARKYRGEPWQK